MKKSKLKNKMLKLKPHEQEKGYTCGPASLKIVLDYYGIKESEENLAKICKSTKEGTKIKNIINAAKKFGLTGKIKDNSSIEDLKKNIKQRNPIIVDWFLEDDGHYSVVAGIDQKNIYLQDPSIGKLRTIELQKFNRLWFDFTGEVPKSKKDFILRRMIMLKKE